MTKVSNRGRLGQAQILAAILFLFLIPTTVIIAENATNSSSPPTFPNLSLEGNLVLNTSDIVNESPTNVTIETPVSNESSETNSSVDEELPTNQTVMNKTNQTEINVTLLLNQTLNETINLTEPTNETINLTLTRIKTVKPPEILPISISYPILIVSINGPDEIVRGDDLVFSVEITNVGNETARHVNGFWELPDLSEHEFECNDLVAGETCTRELILPTTVGTPVGGKEIGVVVRYD